MKAVALALIACIGTAVADDAVTSLPPSGPIPEQHDSNVGYRTVAEALSALTKAPGLDVANRGGWTIVTDNEHSTLWSFAPASHPAFPAVVKRTVASKDGSVYVDMQVLCEAAKAACDALVRDFMALNERMKKDMKGAHQ
jgi:hypothetical protein